MTTIDAQKPSDHSATPGSNWKQAGEPDPHGNRYDCERTELCMGRMTDDELANAAFLHYDHYPDIQEVIDGKAHMPIAYMTAVKDRIRWLSRKFSEVIAERDALRIERDALKEQWDYYQELCRANGANGITDMATQLVALRTQFDGGVKVHAKSDGKFYDVQLWFESSYEPNAVLIVDDGAKL